MSMSRDQQLGNYRLIRLLGRGGFADTYLGEQIYLRTPAAIKVIQASLAHNSYESFFTEARLIAGLKHPNIVRLLDFGVESSRNIPYLVMEYAPNGTLRQRYQRGEVVPVSGIVPYVKQVAAALDYAHAQKIIHRDVKPENMLVGAGNEILLADFGIAVVESTRMQTQPMIAGTVSYMAPEQIHGKPVPASDQYALAAVVYEWLCGAPPFVGSYAEVAIQQEYNVPIPLREHLAKIPVDVEQVVLIALAKDPHQRFESVQAFATALEQASRAAPRALQGAAASPLDRQVDMPTQPASSAYLPQEHSAYQASPLASRGEAAQTAYGQGVSSAPAPAPSGEQGEAVHSAYGQGVSSGPAPAPSGGQVPSTPPSLPDTFNERGKQKASKR
jgi:serine/threonine protein kinase